jgi:ArsR family transcriptional regulator
MSVQPRNFEIMQVSDYEILEIHASYCRALANPKRLAILACLERREMSVGELAGALRASLSTVSRHLGVMKDKQLVLARHEGTKVFYRLADRRIAEACSLLRTVSLEGMRRRGRLVQESGPSGVRGED